MVFFEHFKDKIDFSKIKSNNNEKIFFVLDFDKNGAFVSIRNNKNQYISIENNYFSGIDREIIQVLNQINYKNSFMVNWLTENQNIYLTDYPFLISDLLKSDLFVDSNFNKINFYENQVILKLIIEENNNLLKSKIILYKDDEEIEDFTLISDNYIYHNNNIYKINSIGPNFNDIKYLNSEFPIELLEQYLSIFFSKFQNIKVEYKNYTIHYIDPRKIEPCIIILDIDKNNLLYIKISAYVENFSPDFIENYNIKTIALLNDLENRIEIASLIYDDDFSVFNEIKSRLNIIQKENNIKKGYILENNVFIITPELALIFLKNELFYFLTKFKFYGTENLKNFKIKKVRPKLRLKLSSGINFLEGEGSVVIENEEFSLADLISLYNRNSYIPLNDGTKVIIDKSYIKKLERIFKKSTNNIKLSIFDLPIVDELIDEKINEESFIKSKEIFLGFNKINEFEFNNKLINGELREYQKFGFKWLRYLHEVNLDGCLADDMGLGKTVQVISLLSYIYNEKKINEPSLIVLPKTLLFNWENEIKKFCPALTYYIYYNENKNLEEAMNFNLIITTYALLRNDIEVFMKKEFYYVILDESQNIKNIDSKISKGVILLKSKHRIAISGTPFENNLFELYSLFRFLNPTMFGSLSEFTKSYFEPIQKNFDKDVMHELKLKINPFILRRLKKDVVQELPDKIEQILYVEMNEEQQKFYEERRKFYYDRVYDYVKKEGIDKSQLVILQAFTELRQIASIPELKTDNTINSPKRELLIENLIDIINNNHKALVFSNFLGSLEYISNDLEQNNISYLMLTGSTTNRKEIVNEFQNNDEIKVLLMTLKTGGIGLNLTSADYVFIFDPWWNKAQESQAIDRTHRIGQKNRVFCYRIITKNTIEEKILLLQEKKTQLFNSLISSDSMSIKNFTEEDINYILG